MRIMTFNLRFENDRDGENSWIYRRDLVCQVINRYEPDILGTQEGRWTQLLYLRDHLRNYRMHAPHRIIDDTCQYPTLFFRNDHIEVLNGAEFWLSKTPHVHRSKNWDSAYPRMVSYAQLRWRNDSPSFWSAVTHLDHIGVEARLNQAKILADWVKERHAPVILMGDFNDHPGSRVHRMLTDRVVGLVDTWQALGREENRESLTHHGFDGIPVKARMDWILVSSPFKVVNVAIVKDHENGRYPSDHFPYMADVQWDRNTR